MEKSSSIEILGETSGVKDTRAPTPEPETRSGYLKSKVIKVVAKAEPEIQKTSKAIKKELREKTKQILDRLSKKAAASSEVKDEKVDLTQSQKEIQKLENLLDSTQVGYMPFFVLSVIFLFFSVTRETSRSEVTCVIKEDPSQVPVLFLSSHPPTELSSCKDPYSSMACLIGKTAYTNLTACYLLLLLLLFPTIKAYTELLLFQAAKIPVHQYLFSSNISSQLVCSRNQRVCFLTELWTYSWIVFSITVILYIMYIIHFMFIE